MISLIYGIKEYFLKPKIGAQYNYRFETIVEELSSQKRVIQKCFVRDVMIMPIDKQDNLDIYQIFTAKFSINSNLAISDEYLIKQLCYAFDELEVGVDYSGKIIRIYNLTALQFRWNLKRKELEKEYVGVTVQSYFNTIEDILNNELKLIEFVSSYKMFGLYFHGLFGNYLLWEMPIKRQIKALDFDGETVREQIFPEKRESVKYNIKGESAAFSKYEGTLIYTNHQLQEAIVACQNEAQSVKYGTVFLG